MAMPKRYIHTMVSALIRARSLSKKSYTYRAAQYMRRSWQENLTLTGRYTLSAAILTCIAGAFPGELIGSHSFTLCAAVVIVSWFITKLNRPRVTIRQTLPERCVAGSTVRMQLHVSNPTKRTLADLSAYQFRLPEALKIGVTPSYLGSLRPGESHAFDYPLETTKRGEFTLGGPTALSAFPFGLFHARRHHPESRRLIVYPAFQRLRTLDIPVGTRYQPGGIVLTSQVGESMEFIGTREYRTGDRQRDLHPRSWARVGYPVVRQFQEEFLTRIALVVDTHSPEPDWTWFPPLEGRTSWARAREVARILWSGATEPPDRPLEANLSLAAAIADHLARREYVVDLFAAGPQLYHFQAGRSLGYLDNILDILACIRRCPTQPFDVIAPAFKEALGQTSTVIALFLGWDTTREKFVRQVLAAGAKIKAVVVSESIPTGTIPGPDGPIRVLTPAQVAAGVEFL